MRGPRGLPVALLVGAIGLLLMPGPVGAVPAPVPAIAPLGHPAVLSPTANVPREALGRPVGTAPPVASILATLRSGAVSDSPTITGLVPALARAGAGLHVGASATGNASNATWLNQTPGSFDAILQGLLLLPSYGFDPSDGYLLLGGGLSPSGSAQLSFNTYGFSDGLWSNLTQGPQPVGRGGSAAAWDYADDEFVQFGGLGATSGATLLLGDTWTFQGGSWTNASGPVHPSPRYAAAMAYDPTAGALVLFGGDGTSGALNDTWEFRGGVWTELSPSTAPPGRIGASLAWDAGTSELILFGGETVTNGTTPAVLNDTWAFAGGAWTQLHPATSPSARFLSPLVNDSASGQLLLIGGMNVTGVVARDTWNFTGTDWQPVPGATPAFFYPEATFDPLANAVVLLTSNFTLVNGSLGPGFGGQTWQFAGSRWIEVNRLFIPGPTALPGLAGDAALGGLLEFGGANASGAVLNGTWALRGNVWQELFPILRPAPRIGGLLIDDPALGGVVLFGGENGTAYFNDTWVYTPGGWGPDLSGSAPSPRVPAAATYDPATGSIVLFGGNNATVDFNDTWILPPNGSWQRDPGAGGPPPRTDASGAYDPVLGAPVLFGGTNATPVQRSGTFYGDTWALEGATSGLPESGVWTSIASTLAPAPRASAEFAEDPAIRADVLSGGIGATSEFSDTWELRGGEWSPIAPEAPAELVAAAGFAFDPSSGLLRQYGGIEVVTSPVPAIAFLGYTYSFDEIDLGATASPSSGSTPLNVQFTGALAGGAAPVTALWTFGDGGVSTLLDPSYTYYDPGTFNVELTATDAFGLTAVANVTETVTGTAITPLSCTAAASPTGGTAPLSVTFTGTPAGGVAPYSGFWSFGDSSVSPGLSVTHTYASAGTFVATFTANDSAHDSAQSTVVVTVSPGTGPTPLTVTATASTSTTSVGAAVDFHATPAGGVGPYAYAWSFGDGGTASNASPAHAYSTPGNYTANVTVTDANGKTANASVAVVVEGNAGCGCPNQGAQTPPPAIPWALYAAIAAIVLAAGGAIAYLFVRRRRTPPGAVAPAAERPPPAPPAPEWSEGPPP